MVRNINIERAEEIKKMLCSCNDNCKTMDYFNELRVFGDNLKVKDEYNDLPIFASAIASKERLIILNSLKKRDRCVCELEVILNKSQSTISHHLRQLEKAKLIKGWKKGSYTYYGLEREHLKKYIEVLNNELKI